MNPGKILKFRRPPFSFCFLKSALHEIENGFLNDALKPTLITNKSKRWTDRLKSGPKKSR